MFLEGLQKDFGTLARKGIECRELSGLFRRSLQDRNVEGKYVMEACLGGISEGSLKAHSGPFALFN